MYAKILLIFLAIKLIKSQDIIIPARILRNLPLYHKAQPVHEIIVANKKEKESRINNDLKLVDGSFRKLPTHNVKTYQGLQQVQLKKDKKLLKTVPKNASRKTRIVQPDHVINHQSSQLINLQLQRSLAQKPLVQHRNQSGRISQSLPQETIVHPVQHSTYIHHVPYIVQPNSNPNLQPKYNYVVVKNREQHHPLEKAALITPQTHQTPVSYQNFKILPQKPVEVKEEEERDEEEAEEGDDDNKQNYEDDDEDSEGNYEEESEGDDEEDSSQYRKGKSSNEEEDEDDEEKSNYYNDDEEEEEDEKSNYKDDEDDYKSNYTVEDEDEEEDDNKSNYRKKEDDDEEDDDKSHYTKEDDEDNSNYEKEDEDEDDKSSYNNEHDENEDDGEDNKKSTQNQDDGDENKGGYLIFHNYEDQKEQLKDSKKVQNKKEPPRNFLNYQPYTFQKGKNGKPKIKKILSATSQINPVVKNIQQHWTIT